MADTQTTVTNLDIQLLDANRGDATTIKLDNPKDDVTREQVSAAMQPALAAGWFLTNNGSPAMYVGDITVNQSIKTKLGGEDFYITPTTLTLTVNNNIATGTITCSGATIQGYNFTSLNNIEYNSLRATIAENGLSITINAFKTDSSFSFVTTLVIQGVEVNVNCSYTQ